jgi:pimeloyl-ACP methyl ester carboxylesterase
MSAQTKAEVMGDFYLSLAEHDKVEALAALAHVPTLVVAGAVSHPALRTAALTLAGWLPDARYLELDCGHVTYAEQPEQFARAVAAFASEAAGAPTSASRTSM